MYSNFFLPFHETNNKMLHQLIFVSLSVLEP